jgi:hypothetical protein
VFEEKEGRSSRTPLLEIPCSAQSCAQNSEETIGVDGRLARGEREGEEGKQDERGRRTLVACLASGDGH